MIGITGKQIAVDVTGATAPYEYRLLALVPGGDWNWGEPWSNSGALQVTPTAAGTLSLDLQVRLPGAKDPLVNKPLGEVVVFDADRATQLLAWSIQRFRIQTVDSGLSRMASDRGWRASVTSPKAFAEFVRREVDADQSAAQMSPSAEGRFALTALQLVSGLWHYGNYKDPNAPGCAAVNERLAAPRKHLSFADYMSAEIGCCTDYAVVLGSALDEAGIQSRTVSPPGHVFNEAFFDGRWWTLDANIGVAYDQPWDKVTDGVTGVNVYSFSHAGMQLGSPIYSDAVSDFRMNVLMYSASGLMSKFTRRDFKDWIRRTPLTPTG